MDFIREQGELALASRMKRLSDTIMKEGEQVYIFNGINFKPKWFPVYSVLKDEWKLTVMEISEFTKLSHPSIIALLKELERAGLVQSAIDQGDKRKRMITLSPKGKQLLVEIEPVWNDIALAAQEVLGDSKHQLLLALESLEDSLEQKSFYDRVISKNKERQYLNIEIVDYTPAYGKFFESINKQWITEYFELEDIDKKVLENHKEYILDTGGAILFAKVEEKVLGTVALINKGVKGYELAKMGVVPEARGKQIGKKLCLFAIEKAKALGAKRIFLDSSRKLTPAINMYKKIGFHPLDHKVEDSEYNRCDISMEMFL